jgi:hypothetical protein
MERYKGDPGYQAYRILQIGFIIAPLLAGLDKFFYLLVNWNQYLSPHAHEVLGGRTTLFFIIVGIIEIIAGLGVIFKPKIFAYIVCVWLVLIAINLILAGWYDVALRDIGLALGALALGRLSHKYEDRREVR